MISDAVSSSTPALLEYAWLKRLLPALAIALAAIAAVGAPVYSLAQPSTAGGATLGTPNTFIFAFDPLGSAPAGASEAGATALSAESWASRPALW